MAKENESSLVDIRQIPETYRSIFAAYPSFNRVQSTVFLDVFDSDHSVVLSAPTGSGKTVIFELAIVRQLMAAEQSKYSNIFQIVYISPMKALCEERLIDWHKKFSPFGMKPISITGDSDYMDYGSLANHNLIITTPEKWDSITRRWKENKRLIQVIKLFMIDEVHLLNEENRGATLEAMVCRMKTIQSTLFDDTEDKSLSFRQNIRFLAVSATFPNIEDVGDWLGAKFFSFENSMRPVKLNTMVLGFNHNRSCPLFKFDISLNYKLPGLILKYSNGKPTLIFCSTRKSVEMAAKHLVQTLTIPLNDNQKEILIRAGSSITDTKLRSGLVHGIGYHHGGLLPETRSIVEQLFRSGGLPVLVTTSTLATGVNLPAHLVIIKSTKFYDKGGFQDYGASALLQMLGRAGRPQFDTEATALILTSSADVAKFEKMVDGKENIESNLHRHLTEHLNAEIVLRTITDLDVAMRWLASTFLYIRARKNPRHYGIPLGLTKDKIDKKLLEICQIDLNKLVKGGMASMDEDVNISPTFFGTLMAKYYISFESMKLFKSMNGNEILQQVLTQISKSKEFSDMRLRVDEKKCLNLLNKTNSKNTIRFPLSGKIKTLDMKINCIIQAVFGCLEIEDHSILSEAFRIMRLGERISRCLIEYLETRDNCYSALLNTTILWKCFRSQLWENSKHLVKQFPGIGLVTSKQLVEAGKTSFDKIVKSNPRDIEMITKKKPPFGNKIVDLAKSMPKYDMKVEKFSNQSNFKLKVSLTLLNPEAFDNSTFVNVDSVMCLLIGDNLNRILLHERYMHSYMLENIEVVRFVELDTNMDNLNEVYCNFVSEDLVGIDIDETFILKEKAAYEKQKTNVQSQVSKSKKSKTNRKSPNEKSDSQNSTLIQTQIDKYMKCKKNVCSPQIQPNISKMSSATSKHNKECVDLTEESSITKEKENMNPKNQKNDTLSEIYSLPRIDGSVMKKFKDFTEESSITKEKEKINPKNQKPNRYSLPQFEKSVIKKFVDFTEESSITQENENINPKNQKMNTPSKRYCSSQVKESVIEKSPINEKFKDFTEESSITKEKEKIHSKNQKLNTLSGRYTFPQFEKSVVKNVDFAEESSITKENQNINPKNQKMNTPCKRYCLSQFDESVIEKSPLNENSGNLQSFKSFTDEEMLESVEFLLDQNQNHERSEKKNDLDSKKSENIRTNIITDVLGPDLDGAFLKLYDKYGSTKNSTTNVSEEKKIVEKNNEQKNTRLTLETNNRTNSRNILKNGKLHSAGSFENALFNPKKDSLTLFRYQPAKRFAHIPRSNDPPSAPESKRKKLDTSNEKVTEEMMENLEKYIEPHEKESLQYSKSIKWRSPLIYSPPVKFSPKIPSTFSFSVPMPRNIDSENSHDWSLNTVETNHSSKTVRSLAGTTPVARKNESQNQGTKFLLSDREYNVAEKPLNNNNNNQPVVQTPQKSRQLQDFFSSSFLEDIGYSEKQKMTSNLRCFSQKKQDLNTSVQSAGSYYHDMVAKDAQEQRSNEALKLSQKPFFLNQNHLSLSENKNSDFGGIANSSQRLDQTFSQRNFAPQNIPMMPDRSIPTQPMNFMGPQSMGSHWTHEGHNNSSGNFPRPEFNLTGRNIVPNESSRNLWHTNSNFKNQYDPSLSSQRIPKYLPESHHDIHYNPEHNQSQSPYTKPTNNFTKDITTFGINRPSEIPQMDQTMSNLMTSQHEYGNFDSSHIRTLPQAYQSQYAKNRFDFDREHSNYQMMPNVPSLNQNQGFFLNQTPYPQFHGPNIGPLWNTFCMVHKMFNCHFCLNQNYAMRPNMNMLNGQHGFSRSKSFNGTSSYPATAPENREPEVPKEYLNSSSFVPYNQQYVNGINRDNSFMQNVGITGPYGLENYIQPNNNTLGYGSDNSNKFGRQALNIPSEMMYQNFTMPDSNENQMTMRENSSNKDFMISKFLNSFDDSMKNQK